MTATRAKAPEVILGIEHSHDTGAALLVGGKIVCAINEERLTRKKQQVGFPRQSIEKIFEITSYRPADIDLVASAGINVASYPAMNNDLSEEDGTYRAGVSVAEAISRLPGGATLLSGDSPLGTYRWMSERLGARARSGLRRELTELGIAAPIETFDHHNCHLATAYYASGQPECLVISNDGFGDALCSRIAIGRDGKLIGLDWNSFYNSLGILYGYATDICGFPRIHHAGKTTGLAARGDWRKTYEIFARAMTWNATRGRYENKLGAFRIAQRTLRKLLEGFSREDVAAGVQKLAEELAVSQLRHFIKLTGINHVAYAGGVHANVRVNQRLAEVPGVKSLFVFPNMADGGLALGAAMLAWAQHSGAYTPFRLEHVYFGPQSGEAQIATLLQARQIAFEKPNNMAAELAEHLARGEIIARHSGPMEYGPRALGNRSILYQPTDPGANDWLNTQLGRSEFMPFAPVLRDVDAPSLIDGSIANAAYTARFMTITFNASKSCREQAPACVHVDGTMRPQIIDRHVNPEYYDILTEYEHRTSHSVLVNTSFNMHEEPIVCSPEDSLRAFELGNLDCLVLGPFLVKRYVDRPTRARD